MLIEIYSQLLFHKNRKIIENRPKSIKTSINFISLTKNSNKPHQHKPTNPYPLANHKKHFPLF